MSSYKVHGRLNKAIKSVEMDRGDYSIERLQSKFGKLLGFGVAIQFVSKRGQGSIGSDKQLEEALNESIRNRKYNLEVVLVKDGSRVKAVGAFQGKKPKKKTTRTKSTNQPRKTNQSRKTDNVKRSTPSSNKKSYSSSSSSSSGSQSSIEKQLGAEINKLRTNPASYIKILNSRANDYKGNVLYVKKGDVKFKVKTHEGKAAVTEAVNTLKSFNKLSSMKLPGSLSKCAKEVGKTIGTGPVDKNKFSSIIKSHGSYSGDLKLLRGHLFKHDDAQDLVIHFLVSDGDKKRSSRNILLNSNLKNAGIAILDGKFPQLCTLLFVTSWD